MSRFNDWIDMTEKRLAASGEMELNFDVGKIYDEMAMTNEDRFIKVWCKSRMGDTAVLEEVELNDDGSLRHTGIEYRGRIEKAANVDFEGRSTEIFYPTPGVIIDDGHGFGTIGMFTSRHKVSNEVYE